MKNSKAISILLLTLSFPATGFGLKLTANPVHDWWWNEGEQPQLVINAADTTGIGGSHEITVKIRGDREDSPICFSRTVTLNLEGSNPSALEVTPDLPAPGFYKVMVTENGSEPLSFNIGLSPEKVISTPDSQPDLKEFWDKAIIELADVELQPTMVEIPEKSSEKRKLYFCLKVQLWISSS